MPEDKQDQAGGRPNWSRFWLILLGLLVLNWILGSLLMGAVRPAVPYTFFLGQVNANNVKTVTSTGDAIQGTFRHQVAYPPGSSGGRQVVQFTTQRPAFANDNLFGQLQANGVTVTANPPNQGTPLWEQLLLWFGPALLLGGLLAWWMRSGGAASLGGLGGMGMGKSKARRYDPDSARRTTFADVAGIDEVKNEVTEIVDFLRDPRKYAKLGAQIPHGVLLSGAPGTGKTLLARAVAGEADVPFFSISASEFVEMIVGVGASRVRDLFDQAKQAAPSIIFIDELDAIGRARGGANSGGGYDEREQTLNQILTEMDGFTGSEGVVVLAATNRPEILDQALLRPGRFDRRVTVSAPDLRGRRQILAVHTRGVPLAAGVDLDALAAATPGMVGADLKNLVNEAALLAARRGHNQVAMPDFTDSLEKITLGTVRGIVLDRQERERTAFHESGHALLGMLTPGADPVRKISIIPRGQALGVTYQAPSADRYGYSETYLRGRITGALGGRAAEEIVYGDVTTGAENDMEHASSIARQMVGRWGMSAAIGPVSVLPASGQESPYGADGVAPATRELVDSETRRIIEDCYEQALATLRGSRDRLDRLAHTLLDRETLEEDEAYAAAGVSPGPAPAMIARNQAPGTTPAPSAPPAAAQAGAAHVTPATS
ncbi:MAG TPA: ATP-dependent zinc metalloprotease FtsH [Streptosporangiaceae bacterium]|nr:ATP-dependent zinc metalloprotease FtsH [Streptosporangiaceae bacterium]